MNSNDKEIEMLSSKPFAVIAIISSLIVFTNLVFLQSRMLIINLTTILALLIVIYFILRKGVNELLQKLFNWGSYWLLLGLAFEAFENGIKKDHSTLSYYFVTTGLAIFTYMFLTILIDYLKIKKGFRTIIENGQNPMIAYVAGSLLWMPIFAVTGFDKLLNIMIINPWMGFLKGIIFTSFVSFTASFFTKKKLFWRT